MTGGISDPGERRFCSPESGNTSPNELQPLALAPRLLFEQHAAQLGEGVGRIIERAEDALPVLDRQGDDQHVRLERTLEEARGRLVDQACELANGVLTDRDPREHHRAEAIA